SARPGRPGSRAGSRLRAGRSRRCRAGGRQAAIPPPPRARRWRRRCARCRRRAAGRSSPRPRWRRPAACGQAESRCRPAPDAAGDRARSPRRPGHSRVRHLQSGSITGFGVHSGLYGQPRRPCPDVCTAMSTAIAHWPTGAPPGRPGRRFTPPGAGLTLLPVNEAAPATATDPGDEALMLAYAGGDVAAFEQLYARHRLRLYRYLLGQLRDGALADELFQDVWQKVIAARAGWTPDASFATWLYRIAHNRLADHW